MNGIAHTWPHGLHSIAQLGQHLIIADNDSETRGLGGVVLKEKVGSECGGLRVLRRREEARLR